MFDQNTIAGPGYTVQVPPGFTFAGGMPAMGVYRLMPPGVSQAYVEAVLQIRPVQAFELQSLMQHLWTFDNPMVAQMNAVNLGLTQVLSVQPVRELPMPQGQTSVREFDALNAWNMPLRVMVLVMRGPCSAVEVVMMMNLYRWTEFVGPFLTLVGQITLQGVPPQTAQIQAVVDQKQRDQVQYQLVTPNQPPVPMMNLPTNVGGVTIVNYGTMISTRDINGTGVALGEHSTATVQQQAAAQAQ